MQQICRGPFIPDDSPIKHGQIAVILYSQETGSLPIKIDFPSGGRILATVKGAVMLPVPTSSGSPSHQYVRRFARHRCSRAMQVRYRKENVERVVKGRCNVVSEGGFGALVPDDLPIGRLVTIEFFLEGMRDAIPLSARVLNHHGFSYGFEFVAPSPLQRSIIADFFYEELHSEPSI
jgi:hypothetical protein